MGCNGITMPRITECTEGENAKRRTIDELVDILIKKERNGSQTVNEEDYRDYLKKTMFSQITHAEEIVDQVKKDLQETFKTSNNTKSLEMSLEKLDKAIVLYQLAGIYCCNSPLDLSPRMQEIRNTESVPRRLG